MSLIGKNIIILNTGRSGLWHGKSQKLNLSICKGDIFKITNENELLEHKDIKILEMIPLSMFHPDENVTEYDQVIHESQFKLVELKDILDDIRKEL